MEKIEIRTGNAARIDREDEKNMLPCRFFVAGFCHRGNRCRFYHPQGLAANSMIIVPPLPLHFTTPPVISPNSSRSGPQHSMFASNVGHIVPPPSARSNSQRRGGRMQTVSNHRNMMEYGYNPSSPTYSEYEVAYNQQQDLQQQQEEPEQSQTQNTVFNHIDWAQFLAPGFLPPPPIHIPVDDETPGKSLSTRGAPVLAWKNTLNLRTPFANSSDTPPEGRKMLEENNTSPISNGKISAKMELQMKVQQIAKELADEPAKHVRNLDSFFRTYNFNALPLSSASMMDENDEPSEECRNDKKNTCEGNAQGIEASETKENVPSTL